MDSVVGNREYCFQENTAYACLTVYMATGLSSGSSAVTGAFQQGPRQERSQTGTIFTYRELARISHLLSPWASFRFDVSVPRKLLSAQTSMGCELRLGPNCVIQSIRDLLGKGSLPEGAINYTDKVCLHPS